MEVGQFDVFVIILSEAPSREEGPLLVLGGVANEKTLLWFLHDMWDAWFCATAWDSEARWGSCGGPRVV